MKNVVLKIKSHRLKCPYWLFCSFMFFLSILLIYQSLSAYQVLRYDRENYCCTHMTRDCELFFEGFLGFHCLVSHGRNINEPMGHQWLVIEIFGNYYEFESTNLHFSSMSDNYDVVWVDEGYIR